MRDLFYFTFYENHKHKSDNHDNDNSQLNDNSNDEDNNKNNNGNGNNRNRKQASIYFYVATNFFYARLIVCNMYYAHRHGETNTHTYVKCTLCTWCQGAAARVGRGLCDIFPPPFPAPSRHLPC